MTCNDIELNKSRYLILRDDNNKVLLLLLLYSDTRIQYQLVHFFTSLTNSITTTERETMIKYLYEKYPDHVRFQRGNELTSDHVCLDLGFSSDMKKENVQLFENTLTNLIKQNKINEENHIDKRTCIFNILETKYWDQLNSQLLSLKIQSDQFQSNFCLKNHDQFILFNEHLLLEIFSFFDVQLLMIASGVCRDWFRLITCPLGSPHIPLVQELDFSKLRGDTCTENFRILLTRFGRNLTSLTLPRNSKCVEAYDDFLLIPMCCTVGKLKKLNLATKGIHTHVLNQLAKTVIRKIEELILEVDDEDLTVFFQHVGNNLKRIQVISMNTVSSVLTNSQLDILSSTTHGSIEYIHFENCGYLTGRAVANLIHHCPNLQSFIIITSLFDDFLMREKNVIVDALLERNHLKFISMKNLSKLDRRRIRKTGITLVDEDEDGDDDEEEEEEGGGGSYMDGVESDSDNDGFESDEQIHGTFTFFLDD